MTDMKLYRMVLGPIQTNCYLAADDAGNAAIIDPADQAAEIVNQLRKLSLTPKEILLTHGHPDHIGGIKGVKKEYPDVPVMIGAEDAYRLGNEGLHYVQSYFPLEEYIGLSADRTLSDGDTVSVGELTFEVIATPGHTEGGVCYRCENYLFSGDTLFFHDIGRTDLHGGDYPTLLASLRKLAALEGDPYVLPGHGEPSSLEDERKFNYYIREALAK